MNYHVLEDVKNIFKLCVNDKNFLELMNNIAYENIKFKAKTLNKKRQRVGFTFEKDNELYTVYFSNLNLTYQDFTGAYKNNSQKDIFKDKINFDSYEAKINFYIPLKKKTYQEKIFYEIYNIVPEINLENYYIKKIEQGYIEFKNKKKDIHVTDENDRIKSSGTKKTLEENVALMITIAKAKNWDLTTLDITGTMDFKIEARTQINIELKKQISNKSIDTDTSKEAAENLREMIASDDKQDLDYE